jgi:hypothetical protein
MAKKGKILKHARGSKREGHKKEDTEMNNPKSQVVSIDTMIATLLFIAAITGLLVYINVSTEKSKMDNIKKEADLIPNVIITSNRSDLSIMSMNRVDTGKLTQLSDREYDDLKSELGLKYDFCVYFEDRNGDVVNLTRVIGRNEVGIGSSEASISGIPCGRRT